MEFFISKPEDCGDYIFFFGSCDGEPFNVSVFWSERGYFLSGVLQDTGECTETYVDTHYYTRKSSAVRAASSYMQRVFKARAERKARQALLNQLERELERNMYDENERSTFSRENYDESMSIYYSGKEEGLRQALKLVRAAQNK